MSKQKYYNTPAGLIPITSSERDDYKKVPPIRSSFIDIGMMQSPDQMLELAQNDSFLRHFNTESDIQQYHNYLFHKAFGQALGGQSPFIVPNEEEPKAIFKEGTQPLELPEDADDVAKAFGDLWNRLTTHGGKLPEPSFLRKTVGHSMTGQFADLLTPGYNIMTEGFGITDDGFSYKGEKLNLTPEQTHAISGVIQRLSGEDTESDFWDKVIETAASLTFDLPLLTITGGISGKIMAGTTVTKNLLTSTYLFPRLVGRSLQQVINFNLLGTPPIIKGVMEGDAGKTLDAIWHNTQMGVLAGVSGTLGTKIAPFPMKITQASREILKRNPALIEEAGGLLGSFGFGYGSTKLSGGSTEDAFATGLAFVATHFTNPVAYRRVINEMKTGKLKVLADAPDRRTDPIRFNQDYYLEKDNKLTPIDRNLFNEKGIIKPLTEKSFEITEDVRGKVRYLNELPNHRMVSYGDALQKERTKLLGKKIFDDWASKLDKEYVKKHYHELRNLSEWVVPFLAGDKLRKTFGRWQLDITDKALVDKMINVSENLSIPYGDLKQYLVSNIRDYAKNPDAFLERLKGFVNEKFNVYGAERDQIFDEIAGLMKQTQESFKGKVQVKLDEFNPREEVRRGKEAESEFPAVKKGESSVEYMERVNKKFNDIEDSAEYVRKITQAGEFYKESVKGKEKPSEEKKEEVKISEIKEEPVENKTVENIKKAQDIVGNETFTKVATELSKGKEELLQRTYTEELANKIVEQGKLPKEYEKYLEKPAEEVSKKELKTEDVEKTEQTEELPPTKPQETVEKETQKARDNIKEDIKEPETSREKEFVSEKSEINSLAENIKNDKQFLQSKQVKEPIRKAYDEAKEISKEADIPVDDILALVLSKSGLKQAEIASVIRLHTGKNRRIDNILAKYNPNNALFNQKAYDKFINSKAFNKATEIFERKREISMETEEPAEGLTKKELAERDRQEREKFEEGEEQEFTRGEGRGEEDVVPLDKEAKQILKGKLGTEVTSEGKKEFADGMTKSQPIMNKEKRAEAVIREVNRIVEKEGGVDLDNFEKVVKKVGADKNIEKLNTSNFDAQEIARNIIQNRAMGRKDFDNIMFDTRKNTPVVISEKEYNRMFKDLRNKLEPLGVKVEDLRIEQPADGEFARAGFTLVNPEGVRVRIDRRFADKDTFREEEFHTHMLLVTSKGRLNNILKGLGWDGKQESGTSWVAAHEALYDRFVAYTEGRIKDTTDTMFDKLKSLWNRIKLWFRDRQLWDEYKFFKDYSEGKLDFSTVDMRARDEAILYDVTRREPESGQYRNRAWETLRDETRLDLEETKSRLVDNSLYGWTQTGLGKAKKLWDLSLPPGYTKYKFPEFSNFREVGEAFTRNVSLHINKIMREAWLDGEYFRGLPSDVRDSFMSKKARYEKEVWDGLTKTLGKREFFEKYELTPQEQKIYEMYTDAVNRSLEISKQGFAERLLEFTDDVASGLTKKQRAELFPELVDAKGKVDIGEANEVMKRDYATKVKAVDMIVERMFQYKRKMVDPETGEPIIDPKTGKPTYDDTVFFNGVRPAHPKNWVIEASRPSDNKSHKPIYERDADGEIVLNEKGKKTIIGYEDRYSTYVDGVHDFPMKINAEREARRIVEDLENQGYTDVRAYRIGDILNQAEYWNRLKPAQLMNLVNAGHISPSDPIVRKLLNAIRTGTFSQHGIHKSYVPGLKNTDVELERGLQSFVSEGVNNNFRQNAHARIQKLYQDYLPKVNEKLENPNLSKVEKERLLTERQYINGYINNITHSDNSAIDAYRGWVASTYTALKPSFLFQQLMQPIQTTFPIALNEAKTNGFAGAGKIFWKGFSDAFKIFTHVRAIQKGEKPPESLGISPEMERLYLDLADMNKLGKVGIEELTSEKGDIEYHYTEGSKRVVETGKRYMNSLSATVEKYTRIQAMMTFYRAGKKMGYEGERLTKYVADKIDESMSQWGAGGRPPLLAPKGLNQKQAHLVKTLDKTFFVFKTFATHNLGLYEKLFRDRSWKALGAKVAVGTGLHGITKFPLMATIFALADIFSEDDTEYETNEAIMELDELIGGKLGTMLARGIPSGFGIHTANLFDERSILATDLYAETRAKSVEGRLAEVMFGAPYGYSKDVLTSANAMKDLLINQIENNGALSPEEYSMYVKNISKLSPLFIRNIFIGSQVYPTEGIRLGRELLIPPEDMQWGEIVSKMMGFTPVKVIEAYEEKFSGIPAKYSRINGRISELRSMRKSIAVDPIYTKPEKKESFKTIAELLKEAFREKAEFMSRPDVRQAIREGKLKP